MAVLLLYVKFFADQPFYLTLYFDTYVIKIMLTHFKQQCSYCPFALYRFIARMYGWWLFRWLCPGPGQSSPRPWPPISGEERCSTTSERVRKLCCVLFLRVVIFPIFKKQPKTWLERPCHGTTIESDSYWTQSFSFWNHRLWTSHISWSVKLKSPQTILKMWC